jgi:hypothetical protein
MEAIVAPQGRDHWDKMGMRPTLEALRSQAGESMVLQNDRFTEQTLPSAILGKLSDEEIAELSRAVRRAWRGATSDADVAPANIHRGRTRRRDCDRD